MQNFALFHCIGPSVQTALLNAPLVVIVGWCLGKPMDLNFEIFFVVLLVLSILVVGNFLRDGKSNYLEGTLLVVSTAVYVLSLNSLPWCRFGRRWWWCWLWRRHRILGREGARLMCSCDE